MSQVVIGTAGHIDHGKTALVKALTGTNTDRLAEEQARGMTIDLGFAFLTDEITIIDVPGHEKFIRNMVSGVSTIQIALLVIAADDGVMPQTREHLEILSLLQIPYGVIALTKIDLAEKDWIDLVVEDIKQLCNETFLKNAPIVRTSTVNGGGIEELRAVLIELAEQVHSKIGRGFFRLQVDRSFTKTGFGSVVTGTVISGELNKGDEVQILPSEKVGRVRGLQSHGKSVEAVKIGDRAAVNIAGMDKKELWRGAELVTNGWMEPTNQIIANISFISKTNWQLKSKQRVRIHVGTQELLARVTLQKSLLKAGETTNIILQFEEPAVVAMDDRFVIRSYSPMETIGGGTVLDVHPRGALKLQKNWAKDLAVESEIRYLQFIEKEFVNPKTVDEWRKIFQVSVNVLKKVITENKLKTAKGKPFIYLEKSLKISKERIIKQIENYHKEQPYYKFMPNEELKEKVSYNPVWFEFVINILIFDEIVRQIQTGFALSNYSLELSDSDQKISDRIENIIKSYNFEPVKTDDILKEVDLSKKKLMELLHVLKTEKKIEKISDDLWLCISILTQIHNLIKKYFASNQSMSVADFKDMTKLTRKSIIPLLEYFDVKKITKRDSNIRLPGEEL